MGVTLPSIDRELAGIDRVLRELGFRLPVGGPQLGPVLCWADYGAPHPLYGGWWVRSCPVAIKPEDWESTMGLCAPHYLEKTADV